MNAYIITHIERALCSPLYAIKCFYLYLILCTVLNLPIPPSIGASRLSRAFSSHWTPSPTSFKTVYIPSIDIFKGSQSHRQYDTRVEVTDISYTANYVLSLDKSLLYHNGCYVVFGPIFSIFLRSYTW